MSFTSRTLQLSDLTFDAKGAEDTCAISFLFLLVPCDLILFLSSVVYPLCELVLSPVLLYLCHRMQPSNSHLLDYSCHQRPDGGESEREREREIPPHILGSWGLLLQRHQLCWKAWKFVAFMYLMVLNMQVSEPSFILFLCFLRFGGQRPTDVPDLE